jgi:hypothetical protein
MKVHVSNFCRAEITPAVQELANREGAGKHKISHDLMPSRQVKITMGNNWEEIPATLKWHRDAWIATIDRAYAEILVQDDSAEWEPQFLLVYEMENYLADNDVLQDSEEMARATVAAEDGATMVIVAVIGESRSTLSVCRNIVSGCQNDALLKDNAKDAVEAHSCFVVED